MLRRQGQALRGERFAAMKELLRSNDAVLISYVSALLEEAGIGFIVADMNMSVLEGSIGALPRRVLVETRRLCRAPPSSERGWHWPCHHRHGQRLIGPADRAGCRPRRRWTTSSAAASAWCSSKTGHRAGSDAVWLQRRFKPVPGDRVLDAGAGVGVAGLCLAARFPQLRRDRGRNRCGALCAGRGQCRAKRPRRTGSRSSTPM